MEYTKCNILMMRCGPLHLTFPGNETYACTNIQRVKKKKKLHILTHGPMRGCGLTTLVVCINDKIHDIRKKNVTIRSDIWTTNIRSLRFRDIREWVTLWRLILQSLGCNLHVLRLHACDLRVPLSHAQFCGCWESLGHEHTPKLESMTDLEYCGWQPPTVLWSLWPLNYKIKIDEVRRHFS